VTLENYTDAKEWKRGYSALISQSLRVMGRVGLCETDIS